MDDEIVSPEGLALALSLRGNRAVSADYPQEIRDHVVPPPNPNTICSGIVRVPPMKRQQLIFRMDCQHLPGVRTGTDQESVLNRP